MIRIGLDGRTQRGARGYHVTRPYHSASSYTLGERCERAWFYRYPGGLSEPRITWDEIEAGAVHTSRQRSSALGVAMHGNLERWYDPSRGVPDWRALPGRVALSGLGHLPHPERVHTALVESPLSGGRARSCAVGPGADAHAPSRGMRVDGIVWAGFRDLVVSAPGEFMRLGIDAPDGWALVDYKSSANIARYALSPAQLAVDFQANLYALATCLELGLSGIPARWVYFETKATRRAKPTDAWIDAYSAQRAVEIASARAREFDTIKDSSAARPNVAACGEYGGCPYHHSTGGPCDARRSIGALIQARVPKRIETNMALTAEQQAKFAAFKSAAPAPIAAPENTEVGEIEPVEAPAEQKRGRGRPARAAAPATAPVEHAKPVIVPKAFSIPGENGPVVISGHPSDVLDVVSAVLGAS